MKEDLKDFISISIRKYGSTFKNKLGLSTDDLMNDIREQVWKGLVTHDGGKKAALNSWIYKLIDNRFKLLYKRSRIVKFNSIDYYAQWEDCTSIDPSHITTDETSEDLMSKRQSMAFVVGVLNELENRTRGAALKRKHELAVYGFLMKGMSISEMQLKEFGRTAKGKTKKYFLGRMEIIRIIKKIHQLVAESQQEAA